MEDFKGQSILNFIKELPNDDACKAYLAKIKWQDGFTCMKCGHQKGCEKAGHKYQCYVCQHVESSTANTLFHKVKFGLQKAFCVVFEMSTSSKSVSSIQMGKRFDIRQGTAWYFMQKVRKAMKSSQRYPLSELIHVDEFTVGGKEEGKQGRSYDSKKKKAVIAVELSEKHQIKRVYVKSIDDYSAKSLTPIFEEHISTSAKIVTDKWRGYEPLKALYNIEQKFSDQGKNFKELHIVIMQLKSWLRAIPTHVSKWHIQSYFDEFCFRINRSQ
ncbi:IS1595 family transposase, partial [Gramella sp. AN32]